MLTGNLRESEILNGRKCNVLNTHAVWTENWDLGNENADSYQNGPSGWSDWMGSSSPVSGCWRCWQKRKQQEMMGLNVCWNWYGGWLHMGAQHREHLQAETERRLAKLCSTFLLRAHRYSYQVEKPAPAKNYSRLERLKTASNWESEDARLRKLRDFLESFIQCLSLVFLSWLQLHVHVCLLLLLLL